MQPTTRQYRSIASKLFIFSALLVVWVITVVLLYDLHVGRFNLSKAALLTTITLLVSGAMARFAIRTMVRPFAKLQQALDRVAGGDLSEVEVARTGDEIELMGHSFNEMIRALGASRAEVAAYRNELEERIRERTDQLEVAMKKAQEASQVKSDFLATMSHELRTPMGGLIGMLDLMQQSTLGPEQHDQLRTARSCAHSLLALLNDILDISKIEAGRMALEQVPYELAPLVEDCCKTQMLAAEEKHIAFAWSVDARIPRYLTGDPLRLRQVLTNLISNAVKFTSRGSVEVDVRGYEREAGEEPTDKPYMLMISVKDTGPGIPPEKQRAIFEKFTQGDGSISRRYGGSGLGLTITQRLVHMQQGTITLESVMGRGSHFTVLLPCAPAEMPQAPAVPVSAGDRAGSGVIRRRILVVEDNVINQKVITALLRKAEYEVEVASDGALALERLNASPFDLVLMDVQMPVMDGLETTRRLRADPRFETLPVVALTAHAMNGDREKCLAAGMNGYLAKPVDHRHLLAVTAHYLQDQPATPVGDLLRQLQTRLAEEETPVQL